jgi:predicted metal-dependent RNase
LWYVAKSIGVCYNRKIDIIIHVMHGHVRAGIYRSNMAKTVRVAFLGGVGEIGKNMTALEYGNDIIVIDAGLTFPSQDMPGIDLVIPDITFLTQNKDKVKAVFLTHGHVYNKDSMPATKFDMVIYGHFHTGFIDEVNGTIVANTGSLSLPKNGTPNSYSLEES